MKPPAPQLNWKDLMDITLVSDFDLLRNWYSAPTDLLPQKEWLKPANWVIAMQLHKIQCAKEELTRIYVEATQLQNWLYIEDVDYQAAVTKLERADQHNLTFEVKSQHFCRQRINQRHHTVLDKLEGLADFGGVHGAG
jgi:hypothetical protein